MKQKANAATRRWAKRENWVKGEKRDLFIENQQVGFNLPGISHSHRREFRVLIEEFQAQIEEFQVQIEEFQVQTEEFRVQTEEFQVQTEEFQVQTEEFRVQTEEFE